MNKKVFFILFLLIILPGVSALDPLAKQGDAYDIRVTPAANGSIASVTANITINDPNGKVIVSFQEMQKNTDSQDFNYTLLAENTSIVGFYDCTVYAFSTIADNKVFTCSFEVSPSGKEYIPEISGPLIFGAILSMIFLSFFLFIVANKIELFPMKVFLLILSGIIAIVNIGFVAGSFQEFFSTDSSLSSSFGALYIMFTILLSGASVFLLIWLVVTALKLWKIKRGLYIDP